MFSPDIVALRQFYASPLGEAARLLIMRRLQKFWPQANGDAMLGIGYATPYIEPYLGQAAPLMVCMPAHQGAAYWPMSQGNLVFLSHESELPLRESSVNRVLLIHSIEHSEHLSWVMKETWRVLVPGGRVLMIVPNRLSFWSRSSISPFGYGRPFNMAQLRELMSTNNFTVTRNDSALFTPPVRMRILWRIAPKVEMLGRLLFPFLGGVLMIEAEKQLYASIREPVAAKRYPLTIPATQPAMGMN